LGNINNNAPMRIMLKKLMIKSCAGFRRVLL